MPLEIPVSPSAMTPEKIIVQREKLLKAVTQEKTFDRAAALVKEYAKDVFESLRI